MTHNQNVPREIFKSVLRACCKTDVVFDLTSLRISSFSSVSARDIERDLARTYLRVPVHVVRHSREPRPASFEARTERRPDRVVQGQPCATHRDLPARPIRDGRFDQTRILESRSNRLVVLTGNCCTLGRTSQCSSFSVQNVHFPMFCRADCGELPPLGLSPASNKSRSRADATHHTHTH